MTLLVFVLHATMAIFGKKPNLEKERIAQLKKEIAVLKQVRDVQKLKIAEQKRQLQEYWALNVPKELDYNADALCVWAKNLEFLKEPRFQQAYQRGIKSGQKIGGELNRDIHIEWRVHVAVWAATHALRLKGDFVECGVNTGVLSLAICQYVDFNRSGKQFFLFDTYCGIPEEQLEHSTGNTIYEECYDMVKGNFAAFTGAKLVRGMIPESLSFENIGDVSYLSIDLNNSTAEVAAIEFFWPKLVVGGVVLLDDYGWREAHVQKTALDQFAKSVKAEILTLPTGQGLLLKA